MNKNLITNLVSFGIVLVGFVFDNRLATHIGLFALSGSITNSLAIYMLFEKVPLLYGSGVIEQRFEEFKHSIHQLIMQQFFTKENIQMFLQENQHKIDLEPILQKTDFSIAFTNLKKAIMESSFGGMLSMFGGEKALDPLKEPFEQKLKLSLIEISKSKSFDILLQEALQHNDINNHFLDKIDTIVTNRLDQLEAKEVKEIIEHMIYEHLGWLVVWGGVAGGAIGGLSLLFNW
jgi:uncharacterized membrane protein YheB (UPF0754 family)